MNILTDYRAWIIWTDVPYICITGGLIIIIGPMMHDFKVRVIYAGMGCTIRETARATEQLSKSKYH
ncbi:hypothetical protein SDC9_82140 [bioreactor metagenome]|uniref:Uncharacterized protein n=1 Tax=bioreactor metagenome TaxID=1076179 RepID=A0A644Z4K7_9ZZZZ